MSRDPFANYDAWLTTDRLADQQDAAYERMAEAWAEWCDEHSFPHDAELSEHPQHDVYEQWLALFTAVDRYHDEQYEADLDAHFAAEDDPWDTDAMHMAGPEAMHEVDDQADDAAALDDKIDSGF